MNLNYQYINFSSLTKCYSLLPVLQKSVDLLASSKIYDFPSQFEVHDIDQVIYLLDILFCQESHDSKILFDETCSAAARMNL